MTTAGNIIAFQGEPGAYSDLACRSLRPEMTTMPCRSFESVFSAVRDGRAALGLIPIENTVAGRVADIHHLMPDAGVHIIGEHFQRINHHLLATKGARETDLVEVHSHIHALNQCRNLVSELSLTPVVRLDTAGAAADIARTKDKTRAVIASELAGEIHGLVSLRADIEDAEHNTTRFLVLARESVVPHAKSGRVVTTFVFRVRNVPAALYKALGGFATNGVNITKLESYQLDGSFYATRFYADVEEHPDNGPLKLALEELAFFTQEIRILGVYPAHPYRYMSDALNES